jgi:hypothetical protein
VVIIETQKRYNFIINGTLVSVVSLKNPEKALRWAVMKYIRQKKIKVTKEPIKLEIRCVGKENIE